MNTLSEIFHRTFGQISFEEYRLILREELPFWFYFLCAVLGWILLLNKRRELRPWACKIGLRGLGMVYRFFAEHCAGPSWRTTLLGLVAITIGLRALTLLWVHYQSVWFNVLYVETGPIALLIVGWALLHARDHRSP